MNKAQVTLFVVLSVSIILFVSLVVYISENSKKEIINEGFNEDTRVMMSSALEDCIKSISSEEFKLLQDNPGYIPGIIIPESAYVNNANYNILYTQLGGLPEYTLQEVFDYITERINYGVPICMMPTISYLDSTGKIADLQLTTVNIYPDESMNAIVNYTYVIDLSETSESVTIQTRINTNLPYFINKSSGISNDLDKQGFDPLLNYQICNQLDRLYNVHPLYRTDIFRKLAGDVDIVVMPSNDVFVIKLYKDKDIFAFAVQPTHGQDFPMC